MAKRSTWVLAFLALIFLGHERATAGQISLGVVNSDAGGVPIAQLMATGLFSSVTSIDAQSSTPSLATLNQYQAILAFTNFVPQNGTTLGNVLGQYVAEGNRVTLATYSFSNPWSIGGSIMAGSNATLTNVGINGVVSGHLVAVVPGNPIFNGVNVSSITYYENGNYAHPGLASGATLLATDGAGVDMIALSSNGLVTGINVFPDGNVGNSQGLYQIIGNSLNPQVAATPEPSTLALFGMACVSGTGYFGWKRRKSWATMTPA
jgi:PEP-CTERM motif